MFPRFALRPCPSCSWKMQQHCTSAGCPGWQVCQRCELIHSPRHARTIAYKDKGP